MAYAISGTFDKNNANLKPYLYYSYTQDINNNTSTITLTLKIKKLTSYATTHGYNIPYEIKLGSHSSKGTVNFDCRNASVGSFITVKSFTKTLQHNIDGTLKTKISAIFDLSNFNPGKGVISPYEITWKTIPHQSTLTLDKSEYYLGENLTGNINSYSSSFYHKLIYYINKENISTNKLETNTNFSSPISLDWDKLDSFKNSITTTCYIELYTYSDSSYSNQVGDMYKTTCKLNLPINNEYLQDYFTFDIGATSIISIDSNNYEVFLKDKTRCKFKKIYVSSNTGSIISSIRIIGTNGYDSGQINYLSLSGITYTTPILTTAGTITYSIYATDNRGITIESPIKKSITVMEYTLPKFKSVLTKRVIKDNNGNYIDSDEGNYLKSVIDFSYFTLDNINTIQNLIISFYKNDILFERRYIFSNNILIDQDNVSFYGIQNNDSYYYTLYWDIDLLADDSYSINYKLTDLYNTVEYTDTLSTSYFIMDIAPNGKSIAFGKSAEEDEENLGFEIAMPIRFTFNNNKYKIDNTGFYLNDQKIKLINENYNLTDETSNIVLGSNSSYYIYKKALTSLRISLDNSIFNNLNIYNKINFSTSSTFLFNSNSDIYYVGTDCVNGIFTPATSSFYSIEFECALNKVLAKVFGISSISSSSEEEETEGDNGSGGIEIITPPATENDNPEPFPYVDQLIALAMTYYNKAKDDKYFEYGSKNKTILSYGLPSDSEGAAGVAATSCLGSSCDNSGGTHYRTDGKLRRYCDCSTFTGLPLRGISQDKSRYNSWSKNNSEFKPIDYEWALDFRDTRDVSSSNGGIRTAADIGEFFEKRGWLLDNNLWNSNDFSKLKKGDIIFWDRDNEDNGRWNNVSHVGICMGTDIDEEIFKKRYSDITSENNTDITILECTTGLPYNKEDCNNQNYGIRFVKLKDSQPSKVTYVGRIQYKTYKIATVNNSSGSGINVRTGPSSSKDTEGNYIYEIIGFVNNNTVVEIIDESSGRSPIWYKIKYNVTSGTYQGRTSGWISSSSLSNIQNYSENSSSNSTTNNAEYLNCYNESGSIDGNKYIYKFSQCKVTGYGGDSSSACDISLDFAKTCGTLNLPYGTKIYIPALNGKTFTDGNGISITSNGIFTTNDCGVGCTDFDLYLSTKNDSDAEKVYSKTIGNILRTDVYVLSWGSGHGTAWSYTSSFKWAENNGTLSAFNSAFKDYIDYNNGGTKGALINFLTYRTDDKDIRSSTYWNTLTK